MLGAWDVFDIRDGDNVIEFGSTEYDRLFSRRLRSGLDALGVRRRPRGAARGPLHAPGRRRGAAVPALPERGDDARVAHINTLLRHAAARDPEHVTFIEGPDEWCNDEAIATDVDYRWDGVHVYTKGANLVFETIAAGAAGDPDRPATDAKLPSSRQSCYR